MISDDNAAIYHNKWGRKRSIFLDVAIQVVFNKTKNIVLTNLILVGR